MKKAGFTLIELLAVIVILALIALIAVPVVLTIINNSKTSSGKESIKLYLGTVADNVAKENMNKNLGTTNGNSGVRPVITVFASDLLS